MTETPENRLTIYKASAGSGKTYTLVKEYLKLLIRRPSCYQNILAITFTNAATLEMKTRIIESLEELSGAGETSLGQQIRQEIAEEEGTFFEPEDIRNNAAKALSNILNNYSRFEISTIDAFFNRLVRSMARELNLPLRYDIELEYDHALDYAIRELYEMSEEEGTKIWGWLEEFAFSRIEDEKGWKIDNDIRKIAKKIFDEKFESVAGKGEMMDRLVELRDSSTRKIRDFESSLKGLAQKAIKRIEDSGVQPEWFYGSKTKSIAYNFYKIADRESFDAPVNTLNKVLTREQSWYAASSPHISRIEMLAANGLNELTEEICTYFKDHEWDYHTAKLIERNIYAYALLNAISSNLKKYRDEENILFLSDNASLIHGILKQDDTPFIFEKTGSYYKHIFIDEFQDTSEFQWKNLLPLVLNALSDFDESHRIFIVGDVKQSIYRWRGGEMQLLMNGVEKDLANYASVTEVKDLTHNYRSRKRIVQFNNDFFNFTSDKIRNHLPDDPEVYRIDDVYGKLNQVAIDPDEGFVSIRFYQDGKVKWKDQSKEELVRSIRNLFEQGYRKKDMLVLTSTNQEANELANHLISKGVDVISQSSLLLNNIPVIQLLLNILAFLLRNDDYIARCGAVYWYRVIKKNPKEIDFERIRKDYPYFLDSLPEEFSRRIKSLSRKPVYELIEELIVIFKLDHEAGIFLQTFKELSLEHTGAGLVTVGQFLEWWYEEDRELAVTSTAELNAVKVMTIHKSKGLESPVVFVPFCNFSMNSLRDTIFWTRRLDGDLSEFGILPVDFKEDAKNSAFGDAYLQENIEQFLDTLNKTYVAFSRAREQLYIFSQKFATHEESKINNISRFLMSFCITRENWNEVDSVYETGLRDMKKKVIKELPELTLGQFTVLGKSYMDKVNIRNFSMKYHLLRDSQVVENIDIGIKRHEVLSRMLTKDDLDPVLEEMVFEGYLSSDEKSLIRSDVQVLMEDPLFRSWFEPGWQIFAETSIISDGEVYQPDRVLVGKDSVVIVDYKKEVEDPEHEKQVQNYELLLKKMGYKNISKYLVYMDSKTIKEVV